MTSIMLDRKRFLILFILLAGLSRMGAQTLPGLAAYYSFEGSLEDVSGTTANTGMPSGTPAYGCGFLTGRGTGESLRMGTTLDAVAILGPVGDEINREDLTISFYMQPTGTAGIQNLLSKQKPDCRADSLLRVQYLPASRVIRAQFVESSNKRLELRATLPDDQCWHHVMLRREGNTIELYLNGTLVDEDATVGVIDMTNDGPLLIGGDECSAAGETPFEGLLDELAIFTRAIDPDLLTGAGLYFFPDRIRNPATQLFLGESLQVALGPTCGTSFQWTPATGVALPTDAEPLITPAQAGLATYALEIRGEAGACVAYDTLTIQVIDPADLDCNRIFLPTAFTPNADGRNDAFGISNPFAIQELISFEIFDRWGSLVFTSTDPFDRWDGTFDGQQLNPGVLLYRIRSLCDGEELLQTGTVTLIR